MISRWQRKSHKCIERRSRYSCFLPRHRMLTAQVLLLVVAVEVAFGSPKELAKRAFPSVVLITMKDSDGQPLAIASGFFVGQGVVATNYHVLEKASGGWVKRLGQKDTIQIKGAVGVDRKHDLALLSVDVKDAQTIGLSETDDIDVGERVYAIGNPRGLEGTVSDGIVSGIRDVAESRILQITAPLSPGSSGGPVLDGSGKVVGVATAGLRDGQNLNFAIPVMYLRALLEKRTPISPLREVASAAEKEPSIFAGISSEVESGVTATAFRWEFGGIYTFSLHNRLDRSIRNVTVLVIFRDDSNEPLDVQAMDCEESIPPRLAKRVEGRTHPSVEEIMTSIEDAKQNVEFRVLGFEFAD